MPPAPRAPSPSAPLAGALPAGALPTSAPKASQVHDGAPSGAAQFPAQPGILAPQVKDPHAAFRKGSALQPAVFAGAAALMLAGLFFLLPTDPEEPGSESGASPVIGASVSPEIIAEPDVLADSAAAAEPLAAAPSGKATGVEASSPQVSVSKGSSESQSGEFAQAFKSSARR